MRGFRENNAKKWARFALKAGLVLTDAKLWESVGEKLRDRASDVSDEARQRYEDTSDRLSDARDALRGRRDWITPTVNFLGGIGIGVALGMLFAPVSGEEARSALRNKVVDIKGRVSDMASGAGAYRTSPTGTD
ncbi:MAG: YtxH domain-containing protein [Candidatus Sulfotelmatobacter sp.]